MTFPTVVVPVMLLTLHAPSVSVLADATVDVQFWRRPERAIAPAAVVPVSVGEVSDEPVNVPFAIVAPVRVAVPVTVGETSVQVVHVVLVNDPPTGATAADHPFGQM